ncbi:hypothetical protein ElyMa_002841100 [Elysia marginata]|uniref:Uncharacterized protein n=1 Tax=Elysia marginata TaxID=1093978 RepID=A0AAV4HW00_9GAST|nr:hypothetical protein ElyMa_002841100 [Elysia marginata]
MLFFSIFYLFCAIKPFFAGKNIPEGAIVAECLARQTRDPVVASSIPDYAMLQFTKALAQLSPVHPPVKRVASYRQCLWRRGLVVDARLRDREIWSSSPALGRSTFSS